MCAPFFRIANRLWAFFASCFLCLALLYVCVFLSLFANQGVRGIRPSAWPGAAQGRGLHGSADAPQFDRVLRYMNEKKIGPKKRE